MHAANHSLTHLLRFTTDRRSENVGCSDHDNPAECHKKWRCGMIFWRCPFHISAGPVSPCHAIWQVCLRLRQSLLADVRQLGPLPCDFPMRYSLWSGRGLSPTPICVAFVVDKLGQVFFPPSVLVFPLSGLFHQKALVVPRRHTIIAFDSVINFHHWLYSNQHHGLCGMVAFLCPVETTRSYVVTCLRHIARAMFYCVTQPRFGRFLVGVFLAGSCWPPGMAGCLRGACSAGVIFCSIVECVLLRKHAFVWPWFGPRCKRHVAKQARTSRSPITSCKCIAGL